MKTLNVVCFFWKSIYLSLSRHSLPFSLSFSLSLSLSLEYCLWCKAEADSTGKQLSRVDLHALVTEHQRRNVEMVLFYNLSTQPYMATVWSEHTSVHMIR